MDKDVELVFVQLRYGLSRLILVLRGHNRDDNCTKEKRRHRKRMQPVFGSVKFGARKQINMSCVRFEEEEWG